MRWNQSWITLSLSVVFLFAGFLQLADPRSWIKPVLSGNDLFVANIVTGTVGEYNATTGAAINANFITGLVAPMALALSGNTLFVANYGIGTSITVGTVGEYNATSGAVINANFITGLAAGEPGTLPIPLAVAPAAVPEPSPWLMMAVGGVALLGILYRKKTPHHVAILHSVEQHQLAVDAVALLYGACFFQTATETPVPPSTAD